MAISVDTVYKTVLLILNKEQRGYITPEEFNKMAAQAQLGIFEKYFEDLNQNLRVRQDETEYADRVKNIDDKISIFKTQGDCTWDGTNKFFTTPIDMHRIGTVIYKDSIEAERVQRNDLCTTYIISTSVLSRYRLWKLSRNEKERWLFNFHNG